MKKRSLFAAVAMLIVSAIVLTSATYAWFATGGATTQVGKITGDVAQASAGIRLRTQTSGSGGSGWQDSLDYKTLAADGTNSFATNWTDTGDDTGTFLNPTDNGATAFGTYEPISTADPRANTAQAPTIFAYSLANNVFGPIDANKSIGDFYDEYSFYVGTLAEGTSTDVNMKVKVGGDAKMAARVAVYSYGDDGTGTYSWTFHGIYSGASESGWNAITTDIPAVNKDANQNFIVDSSDTGTNIASCITATTAYDAGGSNGQTITLLSCHQTDGFTPEATEQNPNPQTLGNRLVKVFVWLEGNDGDCKPTHPSVPGGDIQVTYTFTMANA